MLRLSRTPRQFFDGFVKPKTLELVNDFSRLVWRSLKSSIQSPSCIWFHELAGAHIAWCCSRGEFGSVYSLRLLSSAIASRGAFWKRCLSKIAAATRNPEWPTAARRGAGILILVLGFFSP